MAPAAHRQPAPGTRPAGARDESEAARRVREMFARITPRYDLLNHLLSLNLDRLWRRRAARRFGHILARGGARALDLCCGTGDLALALAGEAQRQGSGGAGKEALIIGADFVHPMLVRAQEKLASGSTPAGIALRWVEADALRLPFADASFDLVTAAFGFRNLANYARGLEEIARVLRPGGEAGILEFSEPRGWLAPVYRFYLRRLLPRIGGAISGSREAYSYLPASVARFPDAEELARMLGAAGFREISFQLWTAGAVALHTARKPSG